MANETYGRPTGNSCIKSSLRSASGNTNVDKSEIVLYLFFAICQCFSCFSFISNEEHGWQSSIMADHLLTLMLSGLKLHGRK